MCDCPSENNRVWYDWTGSIIIGCLRHPPPEPDKPETLLAMEHAGKELTKNPITGKDADILLAENRNYAKLAGSGAITQIWKQGGTLIAYYVRSISSMGIKKDGWIYSLPN
jgi:maltose-binding protein MalE